MVGNYQQAVQQAEKEYNLNSDFYSFQFPNVVNSNSEYKERIKDLNWVADKVGVNYLKRVRFSGFKKVNNKLDYNQSVQKVKFQISAVKPTKVMKNFGKSPAIITKSSKNLDNKIPGYSVMIEPIKDSLNTPQSREGTFFIETKNKQKIHQFLMLLAQRLS